MAEDWIKMRKGLLNHPKTIRMSSALSADRFAIVGGLHTAWSTFDTYCEDGHLVGYSLEALDAVMGWPGFAAAMEAVEWLVREPQGIVMPRFDTHNGESAKRRANDAERKRVSRLSADEPDKDGTGNGLEKDKRKSKKEQKPKALVRHGERFTEFWELYPDHTNRKGCLAKWVRAKLDEHGDAIIRDVAARRKLDKRWLGGFIPLPLTYLNQERWRDGINPHQLIPTAPTTSSTGSSPAVADTKAARLAGSLSWASDMLGRGEITQAEHDEHVANARARYLNPENTNGP